MCAPDDPKASNILPPLVVVSVVNWNTLELTRVCLRSLCRLTYARFRIVVVDNDSHDDSIAGIKQEFADVTLLRSEQNIGFADAHALAWQQARLWQADAIWLLNSDAVAEPDALNELVSAWTHHGDAIYGGLPLHRSKDGTITVDLPAKFLAPLGVPCAFRRDRTIGFDSHWKNQKPLRVGAVSGSTFFVPLALAQTHGWLDSAWFMYCEEMDYCYRLRKAGIPCYLVPASRIWHAAGGSQHARPRVRDVIQYYRARNEILLAYRYAGRATACFIALKKIIRAFVVWPKHSARARYVLRGAWDGYCRATGKRYAPENYL